MGHRSEEGRTALRSRLMRHAVAVALLLGMTVGGLASVLAATIPLTGGLGATLDISGNYGLNVVMMPIPATLINEIKLDTPAELTLLKFGIEAWGHVDVAFCNLLVSLDSAINIAGLERLILVMDAPLGPFRIKPEIWFATPFESVVDVNHFPNSVIIPPGDMLFVKTRWTLTTTVDALDIMYLFMMEDVNFPNPSADYPELWYGKQSQSFGVGHILTIECEPCPGVKLKSTTSWCADWGTNAVKGYSASGRVLPECGDCISASCATFNETISITGLRLFCDIPIWLRFTVTPGFVPFFSFTGGGSYTIYDGFVLSTSFTFIPLTLGGFTLSTTIGDCLDASLVFSEQMQFKSARVSYSTALDLGLMRATFSGNASLITGIGLSQMSFASSLTQGLFSSGVNLSITNQASRLRFSALSLTISYNQTPMTFSAGIVFGRTGLRQMSIRAGVVF